MELWLVFAQNIVDHASEGNSEDTNNSEGNSEDTMANNSEGNSEDTPIGTIPQFHSTHAIPESSQSYYTW